MPSLPDEVQVRCSQENGQSAVANGSDQAATTRSFRREPRKARRTAFAWHNLRHKEPRHHQKPKISPDFGLLVFDPPDSPRKGSEFQRNPLT